MSEGKTTQSATVISSHHSGKNTHHSNTPIYKQRHKAQWQSGGGKGKQFSVTVLPFELAWREGGDGGVRRSTMEDLL